MRPATSSADIFDMRSMAMARSAKSAAILDFGTPLAVFFGRARSKSLSICFRCSLFTQSSTTLSSFSMRPFMNSRRFSSLFSLASWTKPPTLPRSSTGRAMRIASSIARERRRRAIGLLSRSCSATRSASHSSASFFAVFRASSISLFAVLSSSFIVTTEFCSVRRAPQRTSTSGEGMSPLS